MLILSNSAIKNPVEDAASVQIPYIGIALVLFAIAALVGFSKLPNIDDRSLEHLMTELSATNERLDDLAASYGDVQSQARSTLNLQ